MILRRVAPFIMILLYWSWAGYAEILPGFHAAPRFGEQLLTGVSGDKARFVANASASFNPGAPVLVVFYAAPDGTSVEEALGRRPKSAEEWRFDTLHVAAQIRRLRESRPSDNIVVVCVEPPGRSWQAWRSQQANTAIQNMMGDLLKRFPADSVAAIADQSGGRFTAGLLDAAERVPEFIDRIALLNTSSSQPMPQTLDTKLLAWLGGGSSRRLITIAYDDRGIAEDRNPAASVKGAGYAAAHTLLARLAKERPLTASLWRDFDVFTDASRQIGWFINRNYANRVLNMALAGDMNGVLQAISFGSPDEKRWGTFGGQRAYTRWIEPADDAVTPIAIPPRHPDAETGAAFMKRIAALSAADREAEIVKAIQGGNIPDFLRGFRRMAIRGKDAAGREHCIYLDVAPDYLAVGSDSDFYRIPMTPAAAQAIADRFDCVLPTTRIVDALWLSAEARLAPRPLTEEREAVTTFVQHNTIIEEQRTAFPCGPIVAGIKKDIVITDRLLELPHRVAIYGWHRLDGKPIQPLTIVHGDAYVDYSHGVRLISRRALLDGQEKDVVEILQDISLAPLLSDQGAMRIVRY